MHSLAQFFRLVKYESRYLHYYANDLNEQFVERIFPFQRFNNYNTHLRAMREGQPPALRLETTQVLTPELTDILWDLLESCWGEQHTRPTIEGFIIALDHLANVMSAVP